MPYAAGFRQFYFPSSRIGVHSARDMYDRETEFAKSYTVDMSRFLKELGVPDHIIGRAVTTRPLDMAWLSPDELKLMSRSATLRRPPESGSYISSVRASVQATPSYTVSAGDTNEARRLNEESISLIRANRAGEAIPLLRRAYEISPLDAEIAGNYGYALYLTGALTQARDILALALKLRPERGATWNNLGQTLAALGEINWATECFVNYYKYSSKKDIAYRQMLEWIETGSPVLSTAVLKATLKLQLSSNREN
jgi:tetratricopeptide (TPR) repeat protein